MAWKSLDQILAEHREIKNCKYVTERDIRQPDGNPYKGEDKYQGTRHVFKCTESRISGNEECCLPRQCNCFKPR